MTRGIRQARGGGGEAEGGNEGTVASSWKRVALDDSPEAPVVMPPEGPCSALEDPVADLLAILFRGSVLEANVAVVALHGGVTCVLAGGLLLLGLDAAVERRIEFARDAAPQEPAQPRPSSAVPRPCFAARMGDAQGLACFPGVCFDTLPSEAPFGVALGLSVQCEDINGSSCIGGRGGDRFALLLQWCCISRRDVVYDLCVVVIM